jgi:TonB-linked SusC/RagA family outer membrane protein
MNLMFARILLPERRRITKMLLVMKLTAFLVLLFCLQVSANGYAQRVTISEKNVTLVKVFREINRQTGYQFFYKDDFLQKAGRVSIQIKNGSLEDALDQCFKNLPVTFIIIEQTIVVKERTIKEEADKKEEIRSPYADVRGTVQDENKQPLAGVSVVVKGTQRGTSTVNNGSFLIQANMGEVLQFSMIGYKTKEEKITGELLSIQMEPEANTANEIVVVGYGTQKKSDVTGSVVSLTSENFTQGPNTNALQLLNGRASGVNISQTSSAPGASTKIQIRGAGSINSSNNALVVVDGLPGVDPTSISPDDIKSIEILKDASSAAIYGTRAANGVVLITTKSGKKGDMLVNFSASYGIQSVARKIDVLNGRQYMETLNAIRADGGQAAIFSQREIDSIGAGTNWQSQVFNKAAPVQNYQLSISGGGDKHDYYAGLNYFNQDGLVQNSNFKKLNFRTNFNFNAKEFLRFKLNMNFTRGIQNSILVTNGVNEGAGPINAAIQFDPTLPVGLDAAGKYYANSFIALDNPMALINGISNENLNNNLYGTFTTEIEPLKGLVGTIRLGGALSSSMGSSYRDRSTLNGLASRGAGSRSGADNSQWLAEFLLKYDKKLGRNHSLSVLAGTTFEEFLYQGVNASSIRFLSDVTGADLLQSGDNDLGDNVSSYKDRNRLNGIIGRINYSFKDRYLLTASFRNDGTSRFSDAQKFAFFPSGAFAWRVSKEPFFRNLFPQFSDFKFRLSYGQLGNQGIGNYQTLQTLVAGGAAIFGNSIAQGVVPARIPNRNLRWETTQEFNSGIDFSLWNSRISGSVDFYIRDTKDQLFSKPLPSVVGFTSIMINAGAVRNTGWDIQLNSINIDKTDFTWSSSFNMSFLKNEVTSLPPSIPQIITGSTGGFISNYQIVAVGSPMQSFYGYKADGIFRSEEEVAGSPQPNAKPGHIRFRDQNKDGKIDATDRVILGDPFPDFTAGLNNRFVYKRFSLDLFFQLVTGINTLDANVLESFYPTNEYRNRIAKYYENRWTPQNPNAPYPSGVNPSSYGGAYSINSFTVLDASFLRFKTANLSYSVPLRSQKTIRSVQVYLAADNIVTITDYEGFDPDASNTGSEAISKVNYNSYPLNRTFRMGVNFQF